MTRLSAALAGLLLAGCSTIATTVASKDTFQCDEKHTITRIYSGVSNDIRFLRGDYQDKGLVLWDLPFSLAADTVLLPVTVPWQFIGGNVCDKGSQAIDAN